MSGKSIFEKVGILGLGAMGSGIACAVAKAGFDVNVVEQNEDFLKGGIEKIKKGLRRSGKEDVSDSQLETLMNRINSSTEISFLASCDLVIEAVFEDLKIKKELFHSLDSICKKETIFASNTSSLSITEMAGVTQRKERFIGLHFFNPVLVMPLVEVIKTIAVPSDVANRAVDFIQALGKVPILAKDNSGFIVNLLLTPYLLDAMRAAANGVASVEDIDRGMKLGLNHPMGPLLLADYIGLDILYNAANAMFDEYRDARYAPPPILKKMVGMGYLGCKTKQGFYEWSEPKKPRPMDFNS